MRFFAISLSLDHAFSLQLHTGRGYNNMWHLVEVKPMKKNFGVKIWTNPKFRFSPFSPAWFISFPLNCLGWCSLELHLTSTRDKSHKKIFGFLPIFSRLHLSFPWYCAGLQFGVMVQCKSVSKYLFVNEKKIYNEITEIKYINFVNWVSF